MQESVLGGTERMAGEINCPVGPVDNLRQKTALSTVAVLLVADCWVESVVCTGDPLQTIITYIQH